MKRLLTLCLLLCGLMLPHEASATISLVSYMAHFGSGSSTATTSAISTTGASLIVVVCTGSKTITNVSNSGTADSWNLLTGFGDDNAGYNRIAYAYAPTTSSSQTFSCTQSSSGSISIRVTAWSGTLTTSSVLKTSVGNNESGSITISPGSITPTGSGELFISGASNIGDCTSVVVPTSFADIYPNCATTFSSDMAYFVSSASGPVTPYWTFTGSGIAYSASVLASFCPAAGCNVAFRGNGGFPGFMRSGVDVPWDERFDPYSIWQFQGGHYAS